MPAVFHSILAFLVVLGVLVFVHELGHYLAARLVRRACRGVLDRLRPGDRHLARPRRHGLEARPGCRLAATSSCMVTSGRKSWFPTNLAGRA